MSYFTHLAFHLIPKANSSLNTCSMHKWEKVCCAPVNPSLVLVRAAAFTLHFFPVLLIIWFSKNFSFLGQIASKE